MQHRRPICGGLSVEQLVDVARPHADGPARRGHCPLVPIDHAPIDPSSPSRGSWHHMHGARWVCPAAPGRSVAVFLSICGCGVRERLQFTRQGPAGMLGVVVDWSSAAFRILLYTLEASVGVCSRLRETPRVGATCPRRHAASLLVHRAHSC